MKLDGHAKLTNNAIKGFKNRCDKATGMLFREKLCKSPQFSILRREWKNKEASNKYDNDKLSKYIVLQELSLFGETFHSLNSGYLVREVVAVDLEPMKIRHHFFDAGQKYHFMRRSSNATVRQARIECVEFIKVNVVNWIGKMNRLLTH